MSICCRSCTVTRNASYNRDIFSCVLYIEAILSNNVFPSLNVEKEKVFNKDIVIVLPLNYGISSSRQTKLKGRTAVGRNAVSVFPSVFW